MFISRLSRHSIETQLYLPWLRSQLPRRYHAQLTSLEAEIASSWRLGERIGELGLFSIDGGSGGSGSSRARSDGPRADVAEALRLASQLELHTRRTYRETERRLVPCVAAFVPSAEQERFNGRVIRHLGVWPSRLHLVGMAEAIAGDAVEQRQFRAQIPKVARMMVPRWRRTLYLPRTECLRAASGRGARRPTSG